jgi:hypothetical protein
VWASNASPVVATADCRVPPGQTLVITEGVRVLMAPGASLIVEGSLVVLGLPAQPAVLTAAAPLVGPWKSLVVLNGGDARLSGAVISGGGAAGLTEINGAIHVQGGYLTLTNCEVSGSASNGIYAGGGSLDVESSRFRSNGGTRPTDAALHIAAGEVILGTGDAFNTIENSPFGVYNETLLPVDARGAWWGSATGPQHASNLPGLGVSVSDDVLYDGFITQSPVLLPGDVNRDGRRDLQDVAALARIAGGMDAATPTQMQLGDLVADTRLDLQDAIALTRVVLTDGP